MADGGAEERAVGGGGVVATSASSGSSSIHFDRGRWQHAFTIALALATSAGVASHGVVISRQRAVVGARRGAATPRPRNRQPRVLRGGGLDAVDGQPVGQHADLDGGAGERCFDELRRVAGERKEKTKKTTRPHPPPNHTHLLKTQFRVLHIVQVAMPRRPGKPGTVPGGRPAKEGGLAARCERGVDVGRCQVSPLAGARHFESILHHFTQADVGVGGQGGGRGRGEGGGAESVGDRGNGAGPDVGHWSGGEEG